MLSTLDSGIIFTYLALMVGIGLYASRKQDRINDYFVAGGKLGTFSVVCLWMASWVGGAAIELAPMFTLDQLWPGLAVSAGVFATVSLFSRKAE
jgi:Na+/proline symporter